MLTGLNQEKAVKDGFTIVEVVVAVVLVSLAILTLVSMAVTAQYAQRDTYYMGEANRAANTKIAEMKAAPYDEIANGTTDFSSDPSLDNLPEGSEGEMVVSAAAFAPNSKQIDVTVTYTIGTQQKEIIVTAYVDSAT